MKENIALKGNKYGLTLYINEEIDMEKAKEELNEKLATAKNFLKEGIIAVAFEGKKLTTEEEQELIEFINDNSHVRVMCIIDTDKDREEKFKTLVETNENNDMDDSSVRGELSSDYDGGCFHKGTLRSGQLLETQTSIIILGDVNPGANVVSRGNIVVLGALKGNAYAGSGGDENAVVVAMKMQPVQIRIADTIARCPDKQTSSKEVLPQIAYIADNNICIENL